MRLLPPKWRDFVQRPHTGRPGLCSPSFGPLYSIALRSHLCFHLPFCGGVSSPCSLCHGALRLLQGLPSFGIPCSSTSTSCLASPFVRGIDTSDLVAGALSAFLAGSMAAVPSARAGAAPTTGNTLHHSCAQTPEGSTALTSACDCEYMQAQGLRGCHEGYVTRLMLALP